ncbi:hypothetical protein WMY93_015186 [Mugilogobius chulae]|uniref:Uncharacterized protein n=1 Tax=Mugilogobius chulae TaxID=88201 RepID=A0AAW0NX71_9GOBI
MNSKRNAHRTHEDGVRLMGANFTEVEWCTEQTANATDARERALGFIKTAITFPKSSLGADIEVPTLALIVPNLSSNSPSRLIGTNTLDILYEQYGLVVEPKEKHLLPYGDKVVLKTLAARKKHSVDSSLGEVRLHSKDCKIIEAKQTKVLERSVSCRVPETGKWVTVEAPTSSTNQAPAKRTVHSDLPVLETLHKCRILNRALQILSDPSHPGRDMFELLPSGRRYRSIRCRSARHAKSFFPQAVTSDGLATLPSKLHRCIPVILKNESNHSITLTPKTIIAEIHAIQSVQPANNKTVNPKPENKSELQFDFSNSPVSLSGNKE